MEIKTEIDNLRPGNKFLSATRDFKKNSLLLTRVEFAKLTDGGYHFIIN